jgi:hypothetical protein
MPMKFNIHENIFRDPTNGLLNQRLLWGWIELANATDLNERERENLFRVTQFIAIKLAALHNHKTRYGSVEDELVAKVRAAPPAEPMVHQRLEVSQELFLELDEFLVQLKSALDHVATVPRVMLGSKRWNLRTFGEKGDVVAKALRHNLPADLKPTGEFMREHLMKPNRPWLETAIDLRDRLNHYLDGSVAVENFAVYKILGVENTAVAVPMWTAEQSLRQMLDILWWNTFHFVEDFVAFSIGLRKNKGFAFAKNASAESLTPVWSVTLDPDLAASLAKAIAESNERPDNTR